MDSVLFFEIFRFLGGDLFEWKCDSIWRECCAVLSEKFRMKNHSRWWIYSDFEIFSARGGCKLEFGFIRLFNARFIVSMHDSNTFLKAEIWMVIQKSKSFKQQTTQNQSKNLLFKVFPEFSHIFFEIKPHGF